jgi:hypothetical protein
MYFSPIPSPKVREQKKTTDKFSNQPLKTVCIISLNRFSQITSVNNYLNKSGDVIFEYGRGVIDGKPNEAYVIVDKQIYHADSLNKWLHKQNTIPHTRKEPPKELKAKIISLCKENIHRNRFLGLLHNCLGCLK